MAKRKNSGGIAAMVGRELGKLAARKDALAREMAGIDGQIAAVRDSISRALGAREIPFPKGGAKRAAKAAKRVMSPEARAKMAAAAKRRWAAAKKAGKNSLG